MAEVVWESSKKKFIVREYNIYGESRMNGKFTLSRGAPRFYGGYENLPHATGVAEALTAQNPEKHYDVYEL